jgi:hypothetical protein
MENDNGAGLIHTEHHEGALFVGKRISIEKTAHPLAHQGEVAGMAAELDLLFRHRAFIRLNTAFASFKLRCGKKLCKIDISFALVSCRGSRLLPDFFKWDVNSVPYSYELGSKTNGQFR